MSCPRKCRPGNEGRVNDTRLPAGSADLICKSSFGGFGAYTSRNISGPQTGPDHFTAYAITVRLWKRPFPDIDWSCTKYSRQRRRVQRDLPLRTPRRGSGKSEQSQ